MYQHECEPVVRMLTTACRVVAWGVMPRLGEILNKQGAPFL